MNEQSTPFIGEMPWGHPLPMRIFGVKTGTDYDHSGEDVRNLYTKVLRQDLQNPAAEAITLT